VLGSLYTGEIDIGFTVISNITKAAFAQLCYKIVYSDKLFFAGDDKTMAIIACWKQLHCCASHDRFNQ